MIGRLEKNVIIARSGVYKYEPQALPGLKVQGVAPDGWESKTYYNVYRPANVVMQAKDKFVKLPLIREHQAIIDGKNFRDYALGWTGDTADIAVLPNSNEIGIQSTVNLIDEEAIKMYDDGFRDVSPLYGASFKWASGKSPDGEDYDIIMDDVIDVNHLAFTRQGRGGPGVGMDSEFNEADHPRAENGQFGSGGGVAKSTETGKAETATETEKTETETSSPESAQKEYDEVVSKYKGTDKWMKSPTGKPTKLNEKQWVQTRTPAFKAWFGDFENDPENASKAVDENGDPMIVYHGSGHKFDEFKQMGTIHQQYGAGFYFTEDKSLAEGYGDGGHVYACFINARYGLKEKRADALAGKEIKQGDYVASKDKDPDDPRKIWMVKNPNQIKSATDNKGTFDTSKNTIGDSFPNVETLPRDTVQLDNVDFRTAIDDMVSNRAEYTADEISAGVDFLHSLIKDIPDSEEKKILARLIDDFLTVKDAFPNDEAAKVAADSVVSRYDSLNAKEDNMGLFSGKAKDAVPEETPAQEAPAKPEAPAPAPAEQAPATDAPVAPVPAAAMEVAQMPDDVTTLDDAGLRACLNGVIKALKALMPEEAAEPEHQGEAPAAGEGDKPPMEEEKKEGAAGDSVFTMSLKSNSGLSVKAKDFFDYLNRSK